MKRPTLLLLSLIGCLIQSCSTPATRPASPQTSQVDLFSQKVQAAMQRGEFQTNSVQLTLPDGRKRTITANGWTDS